MNIIRPPHLNLDRKKNKNKRYYRHTTTLFSPFICRSHFHFFLISQAKGHTVTPSLSGNKSYPLSIPLLPFLPYPPPQKSQIETAPLLSRTIPPVPPAPFPPPSPHPQNPHPPAPPSQSPTHSPRPRSGDTSSPSPPGRFSFPSGYNPHSPSRPHHHPENVAV